MQHALHCRIAIKQCRPPVTLTCGTGDSPAAGPDREKPSLPWAVTTHTRRRVRWVAAPGRGHMPAILPPPLHSAHSGAARAPAPSTCGHTHRLTHLEHHGKRRSAALAVHLLRAHCMSSPARDSPCRSPPRPQLRSTTSATRHRAAGSHRAGQGRWRYIAAMPAAVSCWRTR